MGRTSDAKERLLDVAFELIWDNSYGGVSVDHICERAKVNKGSFYYFFGSKADLVVAAYEEHWKQKQPDFDRLFSAQTPPLDRLTQWCEFTYQEQKEKFAKFGHVCGCPYASIGSEIATQDDKIRHKIDEVMSRVMKYVETAIAEAQRAGDLPPGDPKQLAQEVYSSKMGAVIQAKIRKDPEVLRNLAKTVLAIVGAK